MRKLLAVILIGFHCSPLFGQPDDTVGPGHAMRFDGVDDLIDLGNIYDNLTYPFTVSAWVYMDPGFTGGPILVSQDNDDLYNGFWFYVTPTVLFIEYGDGQGGNNPAYRRGKVINMSDISGRWNHVCAVVKGQDNIELFLNGSNMGGAPSGDSNLPMSSLFPNASATIGHFLSNGVIYQFEGMMDEVRIFKKALSGPEIQEQMCRKLTGTETDLIGYWTFDETSGSVLKDKSPNHFDGQLKGNPTRVFSGAPVGDKSKFLYTTNWAAKSLSMYDGDDSVAVMNVTGNPFGIHIYEVTDLPSQNQGLIPPIIQPYFGVFIAGNDTDNKFDAYYYFNSEKPCSLYLRNDNSVPDWSPSDVFLTGRLHRSELIRSFAGKMEFDLGSDHLVCDQSSYPLTTGINAADVSFTWNTGENSPGIDISQTGTYWVEANGPCGTGRDTITVNFAASPEAFSLGVDKFLCDQSSYSLTTEMNAADVSFAWSTGQNTPSITVSQTGVYWVEVENICGVRKDTVQVFFGKSPQIFSLGTDEEWCAVKTKMLKPFTDPTGYVFTWQDGSKQSTFEVTDYGVYWVTIENACGTLTDSVTFSKSEIEVIVPNVITPNDDAYNQYFTVDDRLEGVISLEIFNRWGSKVFHSNSYKNNWDGAGLATGVYFYRITGGCIGEKMGSVSITR